MLRRDNTKGILINLPSFIDITKGEYESIIINETCVIFNNRKHLIFYKEYFDEYAYKDNLKNKKCGIIFQLHPDESYNIKPSTMFLSSINKEVKVMGVGVDDIGIKIIASKGKQNDKR